MLFVNVPQYKFIILCNIAVAPFVGAWIEIVAACTTAVFMLSLPLWERGLKYHIIIKFANRFFVAPFVGAWIEMPGVSRPGRLHNRRSLCGSVD